MELEQKYRALMSSAGAAAGEMRICFEILSLAGQIDRACAVRLAPYRLSESKFLLLSLLRDEPDGAAPHVLADLAGVTRATMTGLLDGMARDGLITRSHDSEDRRKMIVRLTPAGTALAATLGDEHLRWISSLCSGLGPEDRRMLSALLERVRQSAGLAPDQSSNERNSEHDALPR